jgi:hypothetical protein
MRSKQEIFAEMSCLERRMERLEKEINDGDFVIKTRTYFYYAKYYLQSCRNSLISK